MNIGDLYAQTLLASSNAADLILATPENYTGFTPSNRSRSAVGYKFQVITDENVSLNSDITDHYAEDNTARQDHIALRPVVITVAGFVGELNNVVPEQLEIAKEAVDRLGILSAYIPSITNTARRAFNTAQQIYSVGEKLVNATGAALGVRAETKQQKAFRELYEAWQNRTLFYVSTPFGQFPNMAIQSIVGNQNPDTKMVSDFSVTFKQLRFAQVTVSLSNRSEDQIDNRGTA